MPAKLPEPTVKINWRLYASDVELLNVLGKGDVNALGRALIRQYCDRLRAQLAGQEAAQAQAPRDPSA